MGTSKWWRAVAGRVSTAVAAALVGLVLLCAPASAHTEIESTEPAAGDSLAAAPGQLRLVPGEPVDSATLTVVDGCGTTLDVVPVVGDDVVAPLPAGGPGTWQVVWTLVGADGHSVDGAFEFAVEGGSCAAAGATTPTEEPTLAAQPLGDVAEPPATQPLSVEDAEGRGVTPALTVGLLAVPFLVMLALSSLLTRRRRAQATATEQP